jgi:hypothetical protein
MSLSGGTLRSGHAGLVSRDQRVVVVADESRVDVVPPDGETVVPLDEDPDELVWTPLTSDDLWLLVWVETDDGGTTGVVVDSVVVELEDELCANAAPVIKEATIVAANRVLIMSSTPGELSRAGIARCPHGNLALTME